jgi:Tol biopolymer transport system component
MIASTDGTAQRKVASRMRPKRFLAGSAIGPAWSLTGEIIACPVAGPEDGLDRSTVMLVDANSGVEQQATTQRWIFVQQVAWAPHGKGMLVSGQEVNGGTSQISYISYPGGEFERVTNDLNNYNGASLSGDGATIATVQSQISSGVWCAPSSNLDSIGKVTSGTNEGARGLALMPDGRILYTVSGAGTSDIFVVNADGSNPRQLTSNAALNVLPSMTFDGRFIVFVSTRSGAPHLWRMDADGNGLKQLTNGIAEINPQLSPDGQWVVFQNINDLGLWKVSIEGGSPIQINSRLVAQFAISPDGKLIACRYRERDLSTPKLGLIDFATGEVVKTIDLPPTDNPLDWSADGRAVFFAERRGGVSNIWSQPIDGSAPKQLTNFKSDLIFGFDFSEDGKALVLSRGTVSNDVVLISDTTE